MSPKQIKLANSIYNEWFGNDMCNETQTLAEDIERKEDLGDYAEDMSAGEYDAIEAVLFKL